MLGLTQDNKIKELESIIKKSKNPPQMNMNHKKELEEKDRKIKKLQEELNKANVNLARSKTKTVSKPSQSAKRDNSTNISVNLSHSFKGKNVIQPFSANQCKSPNSKNKK